MLTIRLARIGKKNKPFYRLVISPKQKDLYGNSLEILGSYNPHSKALKVNGERIKYWISRGSGMSPTVNNLLIEKKIIEGKKVKNSRDKKSIKTIAEARPAEVSETKPKTPRAEKPAAKA